MLLYSATAPLTAENFRQFCIGHRASPTAALLGYKHSKFHFDCRSADSYEDAYANRNSNSDFDVHSNQRACSNSD